MTNQMLLPTGTRLQVTSGDLSTTVRPATVVRATDKSVWTDLFPEVRWSKKGELLKGQYRDTRLSAQVITDDAQWATLQQQEAHRQVRLQEQKARQDAAQLLLNAVKALEKRVNEMDRDAWDHRYQGLSASSESLNAAAAAVQGITESLPPRKEARRGV